MMEGLTDEEDVQPENTSADTITALEYSGSGEYLATGDRNGRITVLRLDLDAKARRNQECWLPHFQFQSHEPEFDFLKSLEIESKINQIKFCPSTEQASFILSANDKTIKLWKIQSQHRYLPRAVQSLPHTRRIELPLVEQGSVETLQALPKRVFANAHAYHINSLAVSTDHETFFSADDLRVHWWRLDSHDTAFNIVDIKPENMEELTEVITALQCHPLHGHLFSYASSRGAIKLCDTRMSALCTSHPRVYSDQSAAAASKSFITDILNSISDIAYSADGRYIVSRDYLSVKLWDVHMERRPVKTIALHDYLRPMLYDLYTSDTIFDKFEVCCSADGRSVATGSYSNQLKVFHSDGRGLRNVDLPQTLDPDGADFLSPSAVADSSSDTASAVNVNDVARGVERSLRLQSNRGASSGNGMLHSQSTGSMSTSPGSSPSNHSHSNGNSPSHHGRQQQNQQQQNAPLEVRLEEKVLHCAWHPSSNTIAVAGKMGLCLYKV